MKEGMKGLTGESTCKIHRSKHEGISCHHTEKFPTLPTVHVGFMTSFIDIPAEDTLSMSAFDRKVSVSI